MAIPSGETTMCNKCGKAFTGNPSVIAAQLRLHGKTICLAPNDAADGEKDIADKANAVLNSLKMAAGQSRRGYN